MSDLYETDFLAWSERQAALLRQLAAGQQVSELIDWPNVIEEVRDLGLSEMQTCSVLLRKALVHLLKLRVWPESPKVSSWRSEVLGFLFDAQDRFAPSMRQRLGLEGIYTDALHQVRTEIGGSDDKLPVNCPVSLDDLFDGDPIITDLIDKFAGPERLAPPPEAA